MKNYLFACKIYRADPQTRFFFTFTTPPEKGGNLHIYVRGPRKLRIKKKNAVTVPHHAFENYFED